MTSDPRQREPSEDIALITLRGELAQCAAERTRLIDENLRLLDELRAANKVVDIEIVRREAAIITRDVARRDRDAVVRELREIEAVLHEVGPVHLRGDALAGMVVERAAAYEAAMAAARRLQITLGGVRGQMAAATDVAIRHFVAEVEREAEEDMLAGNPREGAHYRALLKLRP